MGAWRTRYRRMDKERGKDKDTAGRGRRENREMHKSTGKERHRT